MDLTKQFKEFGIRNSINPVPPDAQVIYYNMLQAFYAEKWPEKLLIKTQTLEAQCGMTRKRLAVSRNTLIQRGLIKYYPAKQASGSPLYEIVQLYENHKHSVFPTETHRGTQEGTHRGTQEPSVFPTETQGPPGTIITHAESTFPTTTENGSGRLEVLIGLFRIERGELPVELLRLEAEKLLAKKPDIVPEVDRPYVNAWAKRIRLSDHQHTTAVNGHINKNHFI